jgi:hypothetical protein
MSAATNSTMVLSQRATGLLSMCLSPQRWTGGPLLLVIDVAEPLRDQPDHNIAAEGES